MRCFWMAICPKYRCENTQLYPKSISNNMFDCTEATFQKQCIQKMGEKKEINKKHWLKHLPAWC